ncbi:hypothetical protein BDW75DRAFT_56116 [Aspergillus navahoensis]
MRPNTSQSNITPPATAPRIIPGSQLGVNDSPQLPVGNDTNFHELGSGSLDSDLSLDYVPLALPASSSIFGEPNSALSSAGQHLTWDIAPPETGIEFLAESDSLANLQGQIGELRDHIPRHGWEYSTVTLTNSGSVPKISDGCGGRPAISSSRWPRQRCLRNGSIGLQAIQHLKCQA